MLTRREEDIIELENDEKNAELLMEWLKGKEGKRDGNDSERGQQEQVATEGSVQL